MSFQTLYRSSPPKLKQIIIDQWKAKQNPKWHPEGNTLKHIIVVTNRAFKNFPDNRDIQLAAYFHDLGKLATYEINPKSGQPTAYGHEKESVDLIDEFSNFVEQQGANPKIVKYIVQNHMKIKPSTWDIMKLSKKDPILNDPNYQDLEKFSTIDKGGLLELQYLSQNKKTNKMTNQILSEEFFRMQHLAGIIIESQLNESDVTTLADILKTKGSLDHLKSMYLKIIDGPFVEKNPTYKDKGCTFLFYDAREGLVGVELEDKKSVNLYPKELIVDTERFNAR